MEIGTVSSQSRLSNMNFFAFLLLVAALATGQDALFAFLKNTSFYWSESLLYKMYWLLFIPQTMLVAKALEKWPIEKKSSDGNWMHVLLAPLSSLIQILVFSALMDVLSAFFLGHSFQFSGVLRKW